MGQPYHSQRLAREQGGSLEIGADFVSALMAYLSALSGRNYLCQHFGEPGCDRCGQSGSSDAKIAVKLRQELGDVEWPMTAGAAWPGRRVPDLVEFFFLHVSKPQGEDACSWCGGVSPAAYDTAAGRYDYTVEINAMFRRFNHPYVLKNGQIRRLGSKVLDDRILGLQITCSDNELRRLLDEAQSAFFDRSGTKRLVGLMALAGVFERLKTFEHGEKRTSVQAVVRKVSFCPEFETFIEAEFIGLTKVSNECMIRHAEKDKIAITDDLTAQYLFYRYFNLVRLILEKLGLAN